MSKSAIEGAVDYLGMRVMRNAMLDYDMMMHELCMHECGMRGNDGKHEQIAQEVGGMSQSMQGRRHPLHERELHRAMNDYANMVKDDVTYLGEDIIPNLFSNAAQYIASRKYPSATKREREATEEDLKQLRVQLRKSQKAMETLCSSLSEVLKLANIEDFTFDSNSDIPVLFYDASDLKQSDFAKSDKSNASVDKLFSKYGVNKVSVYLPSEYRHITVYAFMSRGRYFDNLSKVLNVGISKEFPKDYLLTDYTFLGCESQQLEGELMEIMYDVFDVSKVHFKNKSIKDEDYNIFMRCGDSTYFLYDIAACRELREMQQ